MLPISTVEKPAFQRMMSTAFPKLKVRGRTAFTKLLKDRFFDHRRKLVDALEASQFVGSTVDSWTHRRKSFVGETVHWYDANL